MLESKISFFIIFVLIILSACQPTKHLEKNELLYDGASLSRAKPSSDQPRSSLKNELKEKVRQDPNKKILGFRFKLWVYQKYRNHHKQSGLRHWLKTKIGEPPSIYDHNLSEQSRLSIQQGLRNNGFLNATVNMDTTIKNQRIKVDYLIDGKGQFLIHDYITPPDTTPLMTLINVKIRKPIIQPGNPYNLLDIDGERTRIEKIARSNGFFEFTESSIYFYLDTTASERRELDLYLYIRPPADRKDFKSYQLGDVTIYPDYVLEREGEKTESQDTIRKEHWTLIQKKRIVKLNALQEAISQDSGDVYNQTLEKKTITYLLDLGIFKYVNLKYEKVMVDSQAILNRVFYLTPSLNQDVGVELEASTERTNFLGYAVGVNYLHRNIFNGAESFKSGISVGAETQAGGDGPFVNTLEANLNTELSVPRLLLPFKVSNRLSEAIPKTIFHLNGSYHKRNTLFTSASILAEMGYSWKRSQRVQHQFYPFQFTLLRLLSTSDEFQNELNANPRLRSSFNNLLILASDYRFTFTNQQISTRKNYFYYKGGVETAGNLASLIDKINAGNSEEPNSFLNIPIAQFARFQSEGRYTYYMTKTELVSRISGGLAIPYGNSTSVPYIRQFFVGGASSNRGFRFRGVGPGTYQPEAGRDTTNFSFFDRVGDIKLEANIEYRFPLPITDFLKGAVFMDVGNVWLTKKSGDDTQEGQFDINRFYRELAVGSGFGIRLDVQYVVIRFDFGIPLHDPGKPDGERWLIRDIRPISKSWRKENIKFNLAIGYPF